MKKPIFKSLILTLVLGLFLWPNLSFAQSDPLILEVSTLKKEVSPNEEVDFIVSYGNKGSSAAKDVELILNYNENELIDLSIGNPKVCTLGQVTIRCFFTEIPNGYTNTVNFTAKVNPAIQNKKEIRTIVRISEPKNPGDDVQNNFAENVLLLKGLGSGVFGRAGVPSALGGIGGQAPKLEEPAKSQGVAIFDVSQDPNWQTSGLTTAGLKFMIRGKEALAWTLGIKNHGFDNPALQDSYLKVLTVVNSLFIIGLLIIAGLWMFSLFVSREYLKRVVVIYMMAVILVNFALPFNKLLIDGSQILQRTFMGGLEITEIVQTPAYDDRNVIGYENQTDAIAENSDSQLNVSLGKTDPDNAKPTETTIGKLKRDFLTPAYTGNINTDVQKGTLELKATGNDAQISLQTDQVIEISQQKKFNPNQEQSVFAFSVMLMTGVAYFIMALLLIFRIVILWALLIVSPVLFLLLIFKSTRSYFSGWASLYLKWLLIGPLLALGIGLMVGIWKSVGIPIGSNYVGASQFGSAINIGFYLPGKDTVNTLSNTGQMMEYLIFLAMLYLPILFALALTRQKVWVSTVSYLNEKTQNSGLNLQNLSNFIQQASGIQLTEKPESKKREHQIDDEISKITRGGLPEPIREAGRRPNQGFSTESTRGTSKNSTKINDLMGEAKDVFKGSRGSQKKALQALANPSSIESSSQREKITSIKKEIETQAQNGNSEAQNVLQEINQISIEQNSSTTEINQNSHTENTSINNEELSNKDSKDGHSFEPTNTSEIKKEMKDLEENEEEALNKKEEIEDGSEESDDKKNKKRTEDNEK